MAGRDECLLQQSVMWAVWNGEKHIRSCMRVPLKNLPVWENLFRIQGGESCHQNGEIPAKEEVKAASLFKIVLEATK